MTIRGHLALCTCAACTRERLISQEDTARMRRFDEVMRDVTELRKARAREIERRDRAEWDCFFHFACENSLLKRQAD
jgi:hypothetical protein